MEIIMLNEAISYARRGWFVFPLYRVKGGICTCGKAACKAPGKHPQTRNGFKDATIDEEQIKKWFEGDQYNIGIVTGEYSGLTVIDIDVSGDKKGAETWAELIAEKGEPATLMSKTGSGGMHVFFKYTSHLKTASNVLGEGIDVRNDGGYIVAPPSIHASGERYMWVNDASIALLPAHLSKRKETAKVTKKEEKRNSKYSLAQVESMLSVISLDACTRDFWRAVGIILGREFHRDDAAWEVYTSWCDMHGGKKTAKGEAVMQEAFYVISQLECEKELSIATIVQAAAKEGWAPEGGGIPKEQFIWHAPDGAYIYKNTLETWKKHSVDSMVSPVNEGERIIKASEWVRNHFAASSITSDPSLETDFVR
jgi:hypothetical protein